MSKASDFLREAETILTDAASEQRPLTDVEGRWVKGLIESAQQASDVSRRLKGISPLTAEQAAFFATGRATAAPGLTPGDLFVNSDAYKAIQDPQRRSQNWSTGPVTISGPGAFALEAKGTLLEGTGAPGSGSGGGMVPVPQVVPGVVSTLFRPLVAEGAFTAATATTNTVRYVTQGSAISGAAGVAEGGLKPESTIGLSTLDEPIKKVATLTNISDELLEDAPAVQMFINGQLSLFVQLEVDRQLIRGAQGGNEVQGLLTGRGVPVYAGGTAAGNKAEQIFHAMSGVRGSAFVEPDWAIMHPSDWETIRLLKDNSGQLYGGGPMVGAYGNGAPVSASGQLTGAVDSLWNKQVYLTSTVGAGTAIVGSRAAAAVYSRGGVSIEATGSHGSNFQYDLVAIRCERRLGLCVFRPIGFCEVRLA